MRPSESLVVRLRRRSPRSPAVPADRPGLLERAEGHDREIWLGGERVDDVAEHPLLEDGAQAIAAYYDLQHEFPDELLIR